MKIAISARGSDLQAEVDPRFGRANWLIIYDCDSETFEALDNKENYNAVEGAGIKVAELVVNKNCDAVITGHLGPKAYMVLNKFKIKGYINATGTVQEVIAKMHKGLLEEAKEADVQGHW